MLAADLIPNSSGMPRIIVLYIVHTVQIKVVWVTRSYNLWLMNEQKMLTTVLIYKSCCK